MKNISVDDIVSWNPCEGWEYRNIKKELFKGARNCDVLSLSALNTFSETDIMWLVLREEVLPKTVLTDIGLDFITQFTEDLKTLDEKPSTKSNLLSDINDYFFYEHNIPYYHVMNVFLLMKNFHFIDESKYYQIAIARVTEHINGNS